MEWNVKNAMNRDVEREHLNKILKEIASRFEQLTPTQATPTRPTYTPPVVQRPPLTVTLTGDVTGTATGSGSLTIETSLAELTGGLGDAPDDGSVYWRGNQQWLAVPLALQVLDQIEGEGLLALSPAGVFENREIVGTEDEIDVENGNGIEFNPTLSLANLPNTGIGSSTVRRYTRDSKGRIAGDQAATTTHLPEGTNLYYTEGRVYESLKATLEAGANILLSEDDLSQTITITATGGGGGGTGSVDTVNSGTGILVNNTDPANPVVNLQPSVATRIANALVVDGSPTDGDIVEYSVTTNSWVPKKDPRELLIDGGNF